MPDNPVMPTYPNVMLNGIEYEPFGTWDITYNDVKTIHETEAGTQEDVIINTGRRSIAVSTVCLQPIATQLVNLEELADFSVKFFDIKTAQNIETTMRVVPGSMVCSKKKNKGTIPSSLGVYTVSFTIEEYA